MDGVDSLLTKVLKEINSINERLRAIEIEQRRIREDILSGEPDLRMKKRILENPEKYEKIKKDIDKEINIKI